MTLLYDVKMPNSLMSRMPNYMMFLAMFKEMAEMHKMMYTLDWISDTNCHCETGQVQNFRIFNAHALQYEPEHINPHNSHIHPAKTQTSLYKHTSDQSSLYFEVTV